MSLTHAQVASGCSEIEVFRPDGWLATDGKRGEPSPFAAEISDNGVAADSLKKAVTLDNIAIQDRNGKKSAELTKKCEPPKMWIQNRMPSSGSLGTRSAPNLLHVAPYASRSMQLLIGSLGFVIL